MTVGERVDLLVNATDDYAEIRLKTSDEFIELMKFMTQSNLIRKTIQN